jgi:hypothetical protein
MIVAAKVSAATQRVPSYEIVPSKVDPDAEQAATLAEKVALYGYDKWRLRRVTTKAVTHALVGGEGFAYPYFDNTVGPYIEDPNTGEKIGQGEIAVKILSANEVGWEPGSTSRRAAGTASSRRARSTRSRRCRATSAGS